MEENKKIETMTKKLLMHIMKTTSYRRYLKKVIKLAKRNYYSKRFENVQGDLKKTWSLINELRGKTKRNIKASFVINGELVEARRQISNEFNKFFASAAKKLNAKLYSSTLSSFEPRSDAFRHFLKNRVNSSIFMSPVTADEIHEIIRILKMIKLAIYQYSCLKNALVLFLENLVGLLIAL